MPWAGAGRCPARLGPRVWGGGLLWKGRAGKDSLLKLVQNTVDRALDVPSSDQMQICINCVAQTSPSSSVSLLPPCELGMDVSSQGR